MCLSVSVLVTLVQNGEMYALQQDGDDGNPWDSRGEKNSKKYSRDFRGYESRNVKFDSAWTEKSTLQIQ